MGKRSRQGRLEVDKYRYLDPLEPAKKLSKKAALFKGAASLAKAGEGVMDALAERERVDGLLKEKKRQKDGKEKPLHQDYFNNYLDAEIDSKSLKDRLDPDIAVSTLKDQGFNEEFKKDYKRRFGADATQEELKKWNDFYFSRGGRFTPEERRKLKKALESDTRKLFLPEVSKDGTVTSFGPDFDKKFLDYSTEMKLNRFLGRDGVDQFKRDVARRMVYDAVESGNARMDTTKDIIDEAFKKKYINKHEKNIAEKRLYGSLISRGKKVEQLKALHDEGAKVNAVENKGQARRFKTYKGKIFAKRKELNERLTALDESALEGGMSYSSAMRDKINAIMKTGGDAYDHREKQDMIKTARITRKSHIRNLLPRRTIVTQKKAAGLRDMNIGGVTGDTTLSRPIGVINEDTLQITDTAISFIKLDLKGDAQHKWMNSVDREEMARQLLGVTSVNFNDYQEFTSKLSSAEAVEAASLALAYRNVKGQEAKYKVALERLIGVDVGGGKIKHGFFNNENDPGYKARAAAIRFFTGTNPSTPSRGVLDTGPGR